MMLSVIAVVINNKEVTERFVSSITQYTNVEYELILIDNASDDACAVSYFKDVADVYYQFLERVDLAKAWNKGIALAKGDYVCVANNDTVVPPHWFEHLSETLRENKRAGMVSPLTFNLLKCREVYKPFLKNFTYTDPFALVPFEDVVWGEFCLFKRAALLDVGGYCEVYPVASGEDLDMNFQLYSRGYEVYVDPRIFVYHQGGASQMKGVIEGKERDAVWEKNFKLFVSRWAAETHNVALKINGGIFNCW